MTPSARAQAAIELLDEIIAATVSDGPPADAIIQRYFKTRRYAGSGDRRAVRELVFRAIRAVGERPTNGRAALLALPDVAHLFDGSTRGPALRGAEEQAAETRLIPRWLQPELSPLVGEDEWAALLDRAPLDLRVNVARTSREAMAAHLDGTEETPVSPWGLRLGADRTVSTEPAFADGLFEVQDEGSQLIALACQAVDGMAVLDLCAGAGGKSLAIAAAAPGARIVATDTNRQRLAQLPPRASRAGAVIESRLLDGGREAAQLAELDRLFDVVLVDAPCSGSGTWRRNPEGRWRLTPDRLQRLAALQARLLDLASPLVKPGGALVYATCSLLSVEGERQGADFLGRHSDWRAQHVGFDGGRDSGPGRLLTPGHDATDGFYVARFVRPC
ncbi:MAG TPA: RsmB/NOP family class I SAM-dependent RNA methyltransferase [Sphingomicrobium sp.]|jgi:16S rRNA (cytosine967-C5)-methyltransferase|nr:RsmB/NOP family class I SAM-dependent RNA methyltransferase [Sphingomicrobium sp.]